MSETKRVKTAEILAPMFENLRGTASRGQSQTYLDKLAPYPLEAIQKAADEFIDAGGFIPMVGEFLAMVRSKHTPPPRIE